MTATATHAIGVDLGGTKILAGVVTRDGTVVRRNERPTPIESEAALVGELETAIAELVDGDVGGIGLGVPGPLDLRTGRTFDMVNLPFHDFPLRDHMTARFGLPVGVDNDANAAAIAEWRVGAGRGVDDLVMLTLGTGLGGGVISGGKPFRGAHGGGVELGHTVIVHNGRPCQGRCQGRGHLEPYVTGLAATRAAQDAFGPRADARSLVRMADDGDLEAREILAEIGAHLGSGMGSFANVFEPALIVIGGGFGVAAWEHLIGPADEVLRREALRPMREEVRVVRAELGTEAGLIGAGFVGFEAADG
jgi:glucokinase